MRLAFPLLLAVLAGPHPGLAAESDPLHLTGSRVRLFVSDRSTAAGRLSSLGQKHTGTVIEVRGDTLLFTAENQSTPILIPTASLTGLEVSRGKRSHILADAGLGLLAGVLAGGVIGYVSAHDAAKNGDDLAYFRVPVGALLGGGVGIVVGAVVGATRSRERWETLSLPIDIGLQPSAGTFSLSAKVTFR
jgi:hypothetical protein